MRLKSEDLEKRKSQNDNNVGFSEKNVSKNFEKKF